MLRRAAADAGVTLSPAYSVDSTAQPGSTLIDSTLTGPDRSVLDRLAVGYAREASTYVAASYSAYVLERLSTDSGAGRHRPGHRPGGDPRRCCWARRWAWLLVAAELRLEPRLQRLFARRAAGAARAASDPSRARARAEAGTTRPSPKAAHAGLATGAEPKAEREPAVQPRRPQAGARPRRSPSRAPTPPAGARPSRRPSARRPGRAEPEAERSRTRARAEPAWTRPTRASRPEPRPSASRSPTPAPEPQPAPASRRRAELPPRASAGRAASRPPRTSGIPSRAGGAAAHAIAAARERADARGRGLRCTTRR